METLTLLEQYSNATNSYDLKHALSPIYKALEPFRVVNLDPSKYDYLAAAWYAEVSIGW